VSIDQPRHRPTIADVAHRAGVSQAAVSFAVNDRPGVSPTTRARILRAAEELGWRPSVHARALTEARARAIGLVLARDPARLETDAFFVRFLSGIERALAARDFALLLQLLPAGDGDLSPYERLTAAGRVDGFLLTDVELDDPRFALLEAARMPVVVAGHPNRSCPFPWLETDHGAGMAAVAEHLVALGHTRIAFVGGPAHLEFVQTRLSRWRQALQAAGVDPGPAVHADPNSPATAAAAALDERPTAVACTSDALALSVLAAARERGLAIPNQLSVTGFDDSPLVALSSPNLTSVRVDYAAFGAAAAAALLAAIDGEPPPDYAPSPPQLVVRASTTAPAR
jgi:LacI family repressor for deo operon, udp, cdd, tsx, nupC, and nupG